MHLKNSKNIPDGHKINPKPGRKSTALLMWSLAVQTGKSSSRPFTAHSRPLRPSRRGGGGAQFFFYLLIHSISLLFIRIWLRQSSWLDFQFLRVASISFLELVPLVWPFSMHSLSVILNLWPKPQSKQPGKPKTIFKTQEHIGKQRALKTTTTETIQWQ